MKVATIVFPEFTSLRCLMMPYIQGDPESVPLEYRKPYCEILETVFIENGDIGFLTIDESNASKGTPHSGTRAKYGRALHTEAGRDQDRIFRWGGWGSSRKVMLHPDVQVLLANSEDNTCAIWDAEHEDTSIDGDIGNFAEQYPYCDATFMQCGDVHRIGILTPHESLPVMEDTRRQFLRIMSSGIYGRESHFTSNPILSDFNN